MRRRRHAETLSAIYQAFLQQRTWKQPELADRIGIKPPALRKWLEELERTGMPLQRDEESPSQVYWSVPPGWFPGGVALAADETTELVRQLFRLPRTFARDKLVRRILEAAPRDANQSDRRAAVVVPETSVVEEGALTAVEDSLLSKRALAFRYYTASRGTYEARTASVQRLVPGPPARVIAVCHRDGALKWFRLDRMSAPRIDGSDSYREAPREAVEAVLRESVGGFHGGGEAVVCAFTVSDPEARWVRDNLPSPMTVDPMDGGVRVSTRTAGVLPLARFVVGLGAAARAETPELRAKVAELAKGALANDARLNDGPAAPNGASGLGTPGDAT